MFTEQPSGNQLMPLEDTLCMSSTPGKEGVSSSTPGKEGVFDGTLAISVGVSTSVTVGIPMCVPAGSVGLCVISSAGRTGVGIVCVATSVVDGEDTCVYIGCDVLCVNITEVVAVAVAVGI